MSLTTNSMLALPPFLSSSSTNPLAPEFPTPDAHVLQYIIVPMPKEADPEWTKCAALHSFPSLKTLPNPLTHPAYYAAAVDTLRLTSWRFNQHGEYEHPLHEAHVQEVANKWRETHPSMIDYPFPPDLRTLLVKTDDKHPADESSKPLWTRACEIFRDMSDFEKPAFRSMTRNQQMRACHQYDGKGLAQEEMACMRYFVRYLVWREWTMNEARRPDIQPTRRELEALFARPEVKKDGLTLADICHQFPMAKDVKQLVYHIEGLAEYCNKDDFKGDPVESVYMSKHTPTEEECIDEITETIEEQGFMPLLDLLVVMYPFGFGHEEVVAATFDTLFPQHKDEPEPSPTSDPNEGGLGLEVGSALSPREATPPPPSPTEVGTPPLSPPSRETTPPLPPPRETTTPPPPSREVTPPPPPPPFSEKKRKRTQDDEPAQPPKKSKTQPDPAQKLVRCSGQTKALKRCKLRRWRPAGQTWLCSKHQ